jgi:hypothetical protein
MNEQLKGSDVLAKALARNEELYKGMEHGEDEDDIALMSYGPGVSLYFNIQKKLITMFLIFSVFASIMMYIYSQQGGMNYLEDHPFIHKTSFGNMGFPSAICSRRLMTPEAETVKMHASCQRTT